MSICFHISCVEKCFTRFFKTVKKFSMFTHQRQQHLDIHILCMLGESPLLQCFYARAQYSLLSFSVTASTFWVTAVGLAMWCNAKILLVARVFALRNWKDSSDWFKKKNIHIFGAWMFYVEASIGICCFITARHCIRYSFHFFTLSLERP